MLDFRYHALSLVAVFLALGIGIVLGSSLGDTVVSNANKDIASSLRGDVIDARNRADDAQTAVGQRESALEAAFPRVAGNALQGQTVAIVASGALGADIQSHVRDAVKAAGGKLGSVSQLQSPPDVGKLGEAVGPKFATLRSDDKRLRPLGRRIGLGLVKGGKLARRLQKAFPDRFGGGSGPADAIAFYREPGADRSDAVKQLEQGLIDGLRAAGKPVVGIEELTSDPSQISFYSNQGLSTVDDVDSAGGRIALALALAGEQGNFGYKKSADSPLPKFTAGP
jgi:hypothetical protein